MEEMVGRNSGAHLTDEESRRKAYYSRLYRKFILLTMTCSIIPLLLVGWGINIHYTGFAKDRMINVFRTQVDYHQKIIELFLKERRSKLQLIAYTHSRDYLSQVANLSNVFEIMNREHASITDLGVIDERGRHLSYIGPYDLMDKNYSQAFWFKEVMEKGFYISDMFMGFRKVPHFIIAVTRVEKGEKWILRATIDTEAFRSLVENVRIGKTGEVYLLNEQGIFQTSPQFSGKIMEKSSISLEPIHEGIEIRTLKATTTDSTYFPRQIVAQTWLKEPRWLLVVKQNYSEAFNDVNYANYATLIFLHLSAFTILIVSIFMTRRTINVIKNRDMAADQLNKQLMQTGKMAAIGELSAGVAHEINNPLAIILTEKQILLDSAEQTVGLDPNFKKLLSRSVSQLELQVKRCKNITQNLLRFARRTKSVIETVDINAFIREIVELMEREARSGGIKFFTDLKKDIPPILSDPSQLQQVFLNLINNAIDAHDGKPYGAIRISTQSDDQNEVVKVVFADTGSGISKENLEKIFDPFFTTKPVGKGTGLGLSICYSTIKQLGGDITVRSELNEGAEFTVLLPYKPPADLQESLAKGHKD
jgi:two-component system NtrC family sensor kinase